MATVTTPTAPSRTVGTEGIVLQPVNRVGGALGLRVEVDSAGNRYAEARCSAGFFRGYENILVGRDVRDAVYIASRCCGYHGGQHSVAAAHAVEMALGMTPPPMAVALRNLGLCAETVHAEAAHLFLLAGPDFSASSVSTTWPELWVLAQRTPAPHAEIHGFATVGDIMRSLDPITGRWYRDAFSVARIPYQMYAAVHGKYPHPQTMVPGGVATSMSNTTVSAVHDYVVRLLSLVDPAKRVAMLITDLLEFCVAAVPELAEVGVGPANFIDSGQWDDPEGYDPSWEGLTERGDRRWAAPGVIADGQLVTSDLREVAEGVEESVTHSYYEEWSGSPHPASKRTVAAPGPLAWDRRYSWSTSARWKGLAVETGPGARLWTTALRGQMALNPFVSARDGAVQLLLPEGALPEMLLEWRPPTVWNAIERTRARLYGIVFAALVAAQQSLTVLRLQKEGRHQTAVPLAIPKRGTRRGAGFSGDGLLGHWLSLDGQVIDGYQVVGPSTFNIGPGGPAEAAINGTPTLEAASAPTGVTALVALRSFDPCSNCATH
jgi:hydrogenase large subunit